MFLHRPPVSRAPVIGQEREPREAARLNDDDIRPFTWTDPRRNRPSRVSPLTAREAEVANLVAHGCTNRQICEQLVIAERTVECHVSNICAKLGFRSRTQVAVWAAQHGLMHGTLPATV